MSSPKHRFIIVSIKSDKEDQKIRQRSLPLMYMFISRHQGTSLVLVYIQTCPWFISRHQKQEMFIYKHVLVCEHRTWQRAQNFFKIFPWHTHTIRWQLDKFHDFWNSFAFYTIKKPLPRKLAALPREHVDRNFETVLGFSLNLH